MKVIRVPGGRGGRFEGERRGGRGERRGFRGDTRRGGARRGPGGKRD